jgi:hypothetical protein
MKSICTFVLNVVDKMVSPGSKGWINKYFDLIEKEHFSLKLECPSDMEVDHFLHLTFTHSGIVFGYPTELIFATDLDDSKWTTEEKLKLLLFESHLFVYKTINKLEKVNKDEFIFSMLAFYGKHNSYSITKIFTFFLKETEDEMLENILQKRVAIKTNLLDKQLWLNYLTNVFVYLDIILYSDFLKQNQVDSFSNYSDLAMDALTAISLSAFSSGNIEEQEKGLFKIFLASASLPEDKKEIAMTQFRDGTYFSDFSSNIYKNWLFKRFLLDVSALTVLSNQKVISAEKIFLLELCEFLEIPRNELEETRVMVGTFVLNNNKQVSFLKSSSSYEKMFSSLSRRWIKVLGRNKDKLATELKQSKELIYLIKKSTAQELSKEEKELVKSQFLDIVKSMPSLAIFMLPGGALLLPLVLKIIPDLIPSAFRENEIDKE